MSEGKKSLIFVCYNLPYWGIQSGPVLFRSLVALAANYDIKIVCLGHSKMPSDYPFSVISVPSRQRFWPPIRWWIPFSRTLRVLLQRYYVAKHIEHSPAWVGCCFHTSEHRLVDSLSRFWRAKKFVFLHDHWVFSDRQASGFFNNADLVITVSDGLGEKVKSIASRVGMVKTIYPCGENIIHDQPKSSAGLVGGIAGSVSLDYIEAALICADHLFVISDVILDIPTVSFTPRFPKNRDALEFLREKSDFLVVYQTLDTSQKHLMYSFPSRLLDFSQVALPILIVAPLQSSLGLWAKSHGWDLWLSDPSDSVRIKHIRDTLHDPISYYREALKVVALAKSEFSRDRLDTQLRGAFSVAARG